MSGRTNATRGGTLACSLARLLTRSYACQERSSGTERVWRGANRGGGRVVVVVVMAIVAAAVVSEGAALRRLIDVLPHTYTCARDEVNDWLVGYVRFLRVRVPVSRDTSKARSADVRALACTNAAHEHARSTYSHDGMRGRSRNDHFAASSM